MKRLSVVALAVLLTISQAAPSAFGAFAIPKTFVKEIVLYGDLNGNFSYLLNTCIGTGVYPYNYYVTDDATLTANIAALDVQAKANEQFTATGTGAVTRTVDAKLEELSVSTVDYGATGDGTTDDTAAIQAAIDAVETGDRLLFVPRPTSAYYITNRLLVDTAGVRIFGPGASCVIRQGTWGKPVFEVRAADVTIQGVYAQTTESKAVISGTKDGEPARGYCAGFYATDADRFKLLNCTSDGFVCGAFLRGGPDDSLDVGGVVRDFYATGVDQGILFEAQDKLIIDGFRSDTIAVSQTGNPSHAIYCSGGNADTYSTDCIINNVLSISNTGGTAMQLKYLKRPVVTNVNVRDHGGLGHFEYVEDGLFANWAGTSMDAQPASNALMHIPGTGTDRNSFNNIYLDCDVDAQVYFSILAGATDNRVDALTIYDNSANTTALINLRGTRNVISGLKATCAGTARMCANIGTVTASSATDCALLDPVLENIAGSFTFTVAAGATNSRIRFDSGLIDLASGTLFSDSGTTTLIDDVNRSKSQTLSNTGTPSVQNGNLWKTGGTTTITMFNAGYVGQEIDVVVDHSLIFDFTGTNIKGNAGADFGAANGDYLRCKFDGTDWYCDVNDNTP